MRWIPILFFVGILVQNALIGRVPQAKYSPRIGAKDAELVEEFFYENTAEDKFSKAAREIYQENTSSEIKGVIKGNNSIVKSTKRIFIPAYPEAFNPSIIKHRDHYLLIFRYVPNPWTFWVSYIGILPLNKSFEPISNPVLLTTRGENDLTPSQSEDARIFSYNNKLYLIYNDSTQDICPGSWQKRDIYCVELIDEGRKFVLSKPIKLVHETNYQTVAWQKNWTPFEKDGNLYLIYTINPLEILSPDFNTGICHVISKTEKSITWNLGNLRGGTPAQLVEGEYLAFFHSMAHIASLASGFKNMYHYFMGAYTFSQDPPYEMTRMSTIPIDAEGFYTYSERDRRVIYPGGFVVENDQIYLAYGKDDHEVWIATLDFNALKKSLITVNDRQEK